MLIHPSNLHKIMSTTKNRCDILSAAVKNYLYDLAKQSVYAYTNELNIKQIHKGIRCKQESIALYNAVFSSEHARNTIRLKNNYLTGKPDIIAHDQVINIKTSWSLNTFPVIASQADKAAYEWQGRGYMLLTGASHFVLAYCLVNTPDDLIGFDQPNIHHFDHIPKHLRVTRKIYQRDHDKEQLITHRCQLAIEYFNRIKQQILNEHEI